MTRLYSYCVCLMLALPGCVGCNIADASPQEIPAEPKTEPEARPKDVELQTYGYSFNDPLLY
jgi:hypothetical protein